MPDPANGPAITVGVCTRDRPEQLHRLLSSLARMSPQPAEWTATCVVDNGTTPATRSTVENFDHQLPGLRYVVHPVPGLVEARNRLVDECQTPLLAIVDDDETVGESWLARLEERRREHQLAAVLGRVQTRFEETPDRWVIDSGVFEFPTWDDGEITGTLMTGNTLIDLSSIPSSPAFDERLSSGGGEDHFLGMRIARSGGQIRYAKHAVTTEWVPSSRLTVREMSRRSLRAGVTDSRTALMISDGARQRLLVRGDRIARGLPKTLGLLLALPAALTRGRSPFTRLVFRGLVGLGQVFGVLGFSSHLYRAKDQG